MRARSVFIAVAAAVVLAAAGGVGDTTTPLRALAAPAPAQATTGLTTPGLDVSAYQHGVDWSNASGDGARFAYIKATEGSTYTNARLVSQYTGAEAAGIARGAFHFAKPNTSNGVEQARYFVKSLARLGSGRVDGDRTLPPMLDMEPDPYTAADGTDTCWGLTPTQMVTWISQFADTVIALTGRTPAIYTSTHWWTVCTGDTLAFSASPLFIASYVSDPTDPSGGPGALPSAWSHWTFWQYTNAGSTYADVANTTAGSVPARDEDVFRGDLEALRRLARGTFAGGAGLDPGRLLFGP